MNAKEKLTCKFCSKIYKDPIMLICCGESICKHHIEELISSGSSNKFPCPLCNEENTNQNFKINKLVQDLIENDLHNLEVDSKFKLIYNDLKTEIQKLEEILKDPDHVIFEEISELKRQVDLERESLKSEIDELANDLIKQLESYEAKFKTEYKTNVDFEHYNSLVESSRKQLEEYESCLNLFSAKCHERKEKSMRSEKIIKTLQPEITELKKKLFSNLSISYKPFKGNIEDLYGKIIARKQKKKEFLGNLKKTLNMHTDRIRAIAVLDNGDLVSGSNDNTIKVWNMVDGSVKQTLAGYGSWSRSLIIHENNCLISAVSKNSINIWDLNDGTVKQILIGHTGGVAMKLTKSGDLASGSLDKTIKIWNLKNGTVKKTLTGHTDELWVLEMLENGDLASGSKDKTIKIWDVDNGTVKRTLTGHSDWIYALALIENGDLVSGSWDNTIKIWNVEDGTVKRTLTGHTKNVSTLKLLDNGDLVSGSYDGTIKIWDVETGAIKKDLRLDSEVHSLEILEDGRLICGCENGTINIYE